MLQTIENNNNNNNSIDQFDFHYRDEMNWNEWMNEKKQK